MSNTITRLATFTIVRAMVTRLELDGYLIIRTPNGYYMDHHEKQWIATVTANPQMYSVVYDYELFPDIE